MGWDDITADDLRTAAKVALASGGHVMAAAAAAWELRASILDTGNTDRIFE